MMRPGLTLLLCFGALDASAQTLAERARRDEVVLVSAESPGMLKAFSRAQASLDSFFADALAPKPRNTGHAVKVRIREGDQSEFFWVGQLGRTGASFTGVLDNEPRLVKNVRLGQALTFPRADIVDWLYIDPRGQMQGSYTTCALLANEKPEEAQALAKQLRLRCD